MSMTLWGIESTLKELMEMRSEATDPNEIVLIEAQIVEYLKEEVRKVDSCVAVFRDWDAREDALDKEIARLSDIKKRIQRDRDRLEGLIQGVMQTMELKKLEGKLGGKFLIKSNPPSVHIRQPEMVPRMYRKRTITLNRAEYEIIQEVLEETAPEVLCCLKDGQESFMVKEIGAELKSGGSVPGCELITDKVHLEIK